MEFYKISYTEKTWNDVLIEAKSEEEAIDKFWNDDFDSANIKVASGSHFKIQNVSTLEAEKSID